MTVEIFKNKDGSKTAFYSKDGAKYGHYFRGYNFMLQTGEMYADRDGDLVKIKNLTKSYIVIVCQIISEPGHKISEYRISPREWAETWSGQYNQLVRV